MPTINILMTSMQRIFALLLRGGHFYCPLCDNTYRKFLKAGIETRLNAKCPGCGSLERHRLLWLSLQKQWERGQIRRCGVMLHVAPEPALADKLKEMFEYISIDMDGSKAIMAMDITALDFQDEKFDAIVCNHVLEHVPQDRKALAELFRVLKPGGWGSIQVPMKGDKANEDLSISDPNLRKHLYGQSDHVRIYGEDFVNLLNDAGFTVLRIPKTDIVNGIELKRISVDSENEVILVLKPLNI
jgi:SAM-dependent methyltransferase